MPQPSPQPSPQPGPGRSPGRTPTMPRPDQTRPEQFPTFDRPIFISGKVLLDDGTPPPEPVAIERVCHGQPRTEGYTDTKGRFSFQLGNNLAVMQDASIGNSDQDLFGAGGGRSSRPLGGVGGRPITERDLMGCELRAVLPGYRSEPISLAGRRTLDNPDVGVILLKRIANVEGLTVSLTSAMAPKDAKKAYEKGLKEATKKKWANARVQFEKAVEVYPKYAAAWFELGRVYEQEQNAEEARKAYSQALSADDKFVKPYMRLMEMAAREQKWEEVAKTSDKVLQLNPYDFPGAYFYNAVANLSLRNYDEAEKSAREAAKLDPKNSFPKIRHVLGIILANKNQYEAAAENLRLYLQYAPQAADGDVVRKQLAELDRLIGAKPAPVAQPQQ